MRTLQTACCVSNQLNSLYFTIYFIFLDLINKKDKNQNIFNKNFTNVNSCRAILNITIHLYCLCSTENETFIIFNIR